VYTENSGIFSNPSFLGTVLDPVRVNPDPNDKVYRFERKSADDNVYSRQQAKQAPLTTCCMLHADFNFFGYEFFVV